MSDREIHLPVPGFASDELEPVDVGLAERRLLWRDRIHAAIEVGYALVLILAIVGGLVLWRSQAERADRLAHVVELQADRQARFVDLLDELSKAPPDQRPVVIERFRERERAATTTARTQGLPVAPRRRATTTTRPPPTTAPTRPQPHPTTSTTSTCLLPGVICQPPQPTTP